LQNSPEGLDAIFEQQVLALVDGEALDLDAALVVGVNAALVFLPSVLRRRRVDVDTAGPSLK
jgi:hypothetical protein